MARPWVEHNVHVFYAYLRPMTQTYMVLTVQEWKPSWICTVCSIFLIRCYLHRFDVDQNSHGQCALFVTGDDTFYIMTLLFLAYCALLTRYLRIHTLHVKQIWILCKRFKIRELCYVIEQKQHRDIALLPTYYKIYHPGPTSPTYLRQDSWFPADR